MVSENGSALGAGRLVLVLVSVGGSLLAAEVVRRAMKHRGEPTLTIGNIYQVDDSVLD